MAAQRWTAERGPDSEIARSAKHSCHTCGFLLPLEGQLSRMFGVCANEYSADGQVVHLQYGCGAHSSVEAPKSTAAEIPEAYDDSAVDVVVLPQQLRAAAKARAEAEAAEGTETPAAKGTEAAAEEGTEAPAAEQPDQDA